MPAGIWVFRRPGPFGRPSCMILFLPRWCGFIIILRCECMSPFWWFALFIAVLTPCIMAALGHFLAAHPPKEPNHFFGYRTRRSMRSIESWKFAQVYSGNKMEWLGLVMLLPAAVSMIPVMDSDEYGISMMMLAVVIAESVALMVPIFLTEKALKEKFGDPPKKK